MSTRAVVIARPRRLSGRASEGEEEFDNFALVTTVEGFRLWFDEKLIIWPYRSEEE